MLYLLQQRREKVSKMAEQIAHTPPWSSDFGQPLIGIPFAENGHEVIRYFIDETTADAAVREQTIQQAVSLAGSWSDLDWDEMEAALDRIRHDSPPTPPITL
jgi:Zn-dependent M28 family amino/carboxypeptidase